MGGIQTLLYRFILRYKTIVKQRCSVIYLEFINVFICIFSIIYIFSGWVFLFFFFLSSKINCVLPRSYFKIRVSKMLLSWPIPWAWIIVRCKYNIIRKGGICSQIITTFPWSYLSYMNVYYWNHVQNMHGCPLDYLLQHQIHVMRP